jgi:hypothetical protein
MQYALLIYPGPGAGEGLSDAERHAITAEYMAIRRDTRVRDGVQLEPAEMTTTVRLQAGKRLVTDGPFADTKEVFGGIFLFEADDLDAAIELAGRIPAARQEGGAVEIRPVMGRPG